MEIEEFEEVTEFEEIEELDDENAVLMGSRPGGDVLEGRPFGLRRTEQSADYTVDATRLRESGYPTDNFDDVSDVETAHQGLQYVGEQLRAGRRALGWGLADLASKTKISVAQLKLIEAGREEELPGRVFVRGFVRCCARALELEGDELVDHLADPTPMPRAVTAAEKLSQGHAMVDRWTASMPALKQGSFAVYASVALLVTFVTLFAFASDFLSTAAVQSL